MVRLLAHVLPLPEHLARRPVHDDQTAIERTDHDVQLAIAVQLDECCRSDGAFLAQRGKALDSAGKAPVTERRDGGAVRSTAVCFATGPEDEPQSRIGA